MRALSISAFLLAFCYSGSAAAPLPSQIDSISLERTACHGTCPVYTVTMRHDGTVTYDGKEFVKVTGRRTRKIPVEQFQELAREVERIGFSLSRPNMPTKKMQMDPPNLLQTCQPHLRPCKPASCRNVSGITMADRTHSHALRNSSTRLPDLRLGRA